VALPYNNLIIKYAAKSTAKQIIAEAVAMRVALAPNLPQSLRFLCRSSCCKIYEAQAKIKKK
jgi:hypothetical protein